MTTQGRGLYAIDQVLSEFVAETEIPIGLLNIFLHHTSASLILCENADPQVQRDLEYFFAELVRDGNADFLHRSEGPDDMPAHIRTILTQNSLSIPVQDTRLDLGTWQGVYLWEHRYASQVRRLTFSLFN